MRAAGAVATVALACTLGACGTGTGADVVPGGNAGRGRDLIVHYGCGSCHVIGGIATANGAVGPSLTDFSSERYIAGNLPSTPENAAAWIERPQRFEPGTIMPDLGVTPAEAADIVAYLQAGQ